MGNWTIYLNKEEEKQIKKKVDRGDFPSVYAYIRHVVRKDLHEV